MPGAVPAALLNDIGRLCASVGAEGLRADLTIARAAAALAASGVSGLDIPVPAPALVFYLVRAINGCARGPLR